MKKQLWDFQVSEEQARRFFISRDENHLTGASLKARKLSTKDGYYNLPTTLVTGLTQFCGPPQSIFLLVKH